MAIVAKHWHGCVYFCAECQKNFLEKFLTMLASAPKGWLPRVASHKKFPRRIFAPGNVGNAGMQ